MEKWFTDEKCVNAPKKIPNCGTAGCIAGWTIAIARGVTPSNVYDGGRDAAERYLGLEPFGGHSLFFVCYWSFDFRLRYGKTKPQTKARARVIADRIEKFIETKGKV